MVRGVIVVLAVVAQVTAAFADESPSSAAVATPPQHHVEPAQPPVEYTIGYRWPRWMPWTVVGGSVALGLLGGLFQLDAEDIQNQYDQRIATECAVNSCNLSDPMTAEERALPTSSARCATVLTRATSCRW